MNDKPLNQAGYAQIFRDSLLAWSRQGTLSSTLAALPLKLPADVRLASEPIVPLKAKRGRRTTGNLLEWPQLKLHAKPNPFFAFVLEGLVDLNVGVTERMLHESGVQEAHGVYHLRMPAQSLLIYPAYVPTSDGTHFHWEERSAQPPPDSIILWVDVMPEGAILHACHTKSRAHTASQFVFIFDTHLFPLTETIIEEMKNVASAEMSHELIGSLLHVWLLRVARKLSQQSEQLVTPGNLLQITEQIADSSAVLRKSPQYSPTVERARNFIEGHINHRLTVEKIAGQAFVSPAQLNRLFRAELQQSVMEYVIEQRLLKAKSLLSNTQLPIHGISNNLGIGNVAYFSRLFREKTGMTPMEYRQRHNETDTFHFSS